MKLYNMKLSNPKQVLNLDDFLPLEGEDEFEIHSNPEEVGLDLDIIYEVDGNPPHKMRCRIHFKYAMYFFKTPFPGHSFFKRMDGGGLPLINSLVEYGYSDMTQATGKKHYRLILDSTGIVMHVIAQSCEITHERCT